MCLAEIAEGKAGTVIIDSDDFKDDDLTGGATSHRTNMMFVQPKKWIRKVFEEPHKAVVNVREKLKQIVTVENQILSYQSAVRGEPQSFEPINICRGTTDFMKKMFVTHALLRIRKGDDISPNEKDIGAFTGFMVSVFPKEDQSKPYYFTTLPKPPTKSVIYTVMEKTETTAVSKNVPFIQFVGDQPVYAYIVELKYENPDKFAHILPMRGSFHIEMSFMSAIYKRLKESNIEDLLVEAGLIAQGSVVQALRGSHYNRATRLYKLFYEAMLLIIISHGKKNNLVPPPHLDDLFKSIGNTGLNSEKRFLVFQRILYDEGFSEYVKSLFKVQESDNHMAKYILSIMNMIEFCL